MLAIDEEVNMPVPTKTVPSKVLEQAQQLYREFYTRCFWHCPRDLVITFELIPLVISGLKKHGGHHGFVMAGKLRSEVSTGREPAREILECR
jgi:hypothetical protein